MWVMTGQGPISIVESRRTFNELVVRARRAEVLQALFPAAEIREGGGDYKYKIFVSRPEVAEVLRQAVMDIDYFNFKASVEDRELHALYTRIWDLCRDYQR